MAENWNSIFPSGASYDYSRVPTHEASSDGFATWQFQEPRRHSAGESDSRSLLHTTNDELHSQALTHSRMHSRQTVQIGALGQLESQVPLTEVHQELPMGRSETVMIKELVQNPTSCSSFCEKSWFQAISAAVIISNVITTIVEMDKPQTKSLFYVSDRVMLCFYVVELCLRVHYFQFLFLCGPFKSVCWNVLDIIVVVAGVVDTWLMPVLPVGKGSGSVTKVLQLLRLLRLLRVFKIVRVFLDIDLSWTEAPAFQSFIGVVILINSLLMGMEIDVPWHGWFYFEQVLLCIYVFELSVRLKNFGTFFFSCDNGDFVWNVLDFFIVTSSVLDSWITPLCGVIMKSLKGADEETQNNQQKLGLGKVMMLMRMLRLMRILRLVKLVKSVRPLFILVTGVLAALQGVAWVLVLTIVTLYAMGILATSLIGKKMALPASSNIPAEVLKPFSTVPNSMFTLFRLMSGAASDTEIGAIDILMENVPVIKLGFVFFMITSSWTLLSILTAVVSENMITTTGQQEEEIKMETAEEDRVGQVQKLKEIFNSIDVTGDGLVEKEEIEDFLSDKNNAVQTARRCRVPVRDVREVLQTVVEASDGTVISFEKFVEYLADVSNVVTEKAVMKIEAKLTNLSRRQSEAFVKLHSMLASSQQKGQSNDSSQSEAAAGALPDESEAGCKGQLKDEVERFMQGLAETTEARLTEIQHKNQELLDSVTGALEQTLRKFGIDRFSEILEFQLHRVQGELSSNTKVQSSDISNLKDGQEQDELHQLRSEVQELRRQIGDLSRSGTEILPPCPASSTREAEKGQSRQTLDQRDVAITAKASGALMDELATQMEARLLATEESMFGLQQKTDAMVRQIEGLIEKAVDRGISAPSVDKFSETLERELRTMRQELLRSLEGQVSKARGRPDNDLGLAAIDATLAGADQESSLPPGPSIVEGDIGSSPVTNEEREE